MAINKRLVILIVVLVVVWVAAIFVFIRMNTQPPAQVVQPQTGQANQQQVPQVQTSPEVTGETGDSTNTAQVSNLPSVEDVLKTPISVDFLEPYFLDVSKLKEAIATKQMVGAGLYASTAPSQVGTTGEGVVTASAGSTQGSSGLVEDATTKDFQYSGFMEYLDGGVKRRKVFLLINGEFVSGFENELIAGRYKILNVESTYILMLDTSDGKVKKLTYIGE